jgi:hypothetical protein
MTSTREHSRSEARRWNDGVAFFIGAAMLIMVATIGGFGPKTRHLALEEISH